MESKRSFKGVWIPKEIWLHPGLNITEKALLVEIDSLDNDPEKGCFASNEYLAGFLGLSTGRTANIISDLRKREFLEQCFFDGRNRGLRLHENVRKLHENVKADFTETLELPSRKREHSNIDINTGSNKERASARETDSKTEPPVSISATPDWKEVAQAMYAHSLNGGKDDWEFLKAGTGYTGDGRDIFTNWAGKANAYQLRNWKDEFRRLGTWLRNEARAALKDRPKDTVTPSPNSLRIHRKTRVS